mgnify:CR=1 FL=1
MTKVVLASSMAKMESLACEKGCSEKDFMHKAALSIAAYVESFLTKKNLPRKVFLLVGKGNNGGDALASWLLLLV